MKKLLLLSILAMLGMTQLAAQDDYEYVPFVREGVKWVYTYENYGGLSRPADPDLQYGTVYLTLEIKGDTVINGKTYKAMHKYYGDAINTDNDTIPIYLREEDKVVYGIVPDGKTYKDCPIGSYLWNMIWNKVTNGEEFELYNFQDPQAYWLNLFGPDSEMFDDFKLQSTSFISIGSHLVKCYNLRHYRMIEGIGVDGLPNAYQWHGYTLFPWRDIYVGINAAAGIDVDFRIRYVAEGDEIIYKSVNYEGEKPAQDDYEYVPFVREGVKWVYTYENYSDSVLGWTADPNLAYGKVYLTLELKGDTVINGKTYKAMHKYYGDAINTVNDTIPVYLREQDKVVYGIVPDGKTYPDCPIGNIIGYSAMWNKIINGEEFVLYDFQDPQAYWRNLFPEMSDADFEEGCYDFVFQSTSFMNIGSRITKCYNFESFRMIEGIGLDGKSSDSVWFGYTLFPWISIYVGVGYTHFKIRYVTEGDEIIYKSVNYEGPKPDQDDYEYVPFVREGVKWVYTYENYGGLSRPADPDLQYGTVYLTLEIKGDTVINGKTYKAMHKYYGNAINTVNDTIPIYLREEDKVVYGFVPDGITYYDCPIGDLGSSIISNKIRNGEEFVLYDYQDPQAYWHSFYSPSFYEDCDYYDLQSTTHINIGTHIAKCYTFKTFRMIEGIGVDGLPNAYQWHGYTLFPQRDIFAGINAAAGADVDFRIRYVTEGDEIIYKSVNFEGEKPTVDDNEYIPYITSGVKFINEKVIVNNGDTTSYYYTYEMTPDVIVTYDEEEDKMLYDDIMWCHYYTGPEIDEFNDSIICGVYLIHPGFFNVFKNEAFNKIEDEGRNLIIMPGMMDGAFRELYDPLYSYNSFAEWTTAFYIGYQPDNYLTSDNFYEVEPTVVDGHPMQRFAHISEQGDTLAYIVQGIGFDSRDMGDLLTPFTRQPDPDADHQEWCGLSHVVKDGKIIYKGMRYREGASDGINEVVADGTRRPADPHYYNLMGQPVGTTVPTTPGIYIHQGRKVVVR